MNRGVRGLPLRAPAALSARGGQERVHVATNVAGTKVLRLAAGNAFDLTLTGNTTIVLPPIIRGRLLSFLVIARQDATGSRTITWSAPGGLIWTGGAAPTASTTASSVDAYTFWSDGRDLKWQGTQVGKGYA